MHAVKRCRQVAKGGGNACRRMALQQDGQVDDQGLERALHEAHHVGCAARAAHVHIHLDVVGPPAQTTVSR